MNPLEQVLKDKYLAFQQYLHDTYYFYYEEDSYRDEYVRSEYGIDFAGLAEIAKSNELTPEVFSLQIEKKILSGVKARLAHLPFNRKFKKQTGWKPLDQLLAIARLKELKSASITRRSGRGKGMTFDVSTLAATFFGKEILIGLDLGRRRSLNKDELEKLKAECAKLKLTLPEIIEPTTTEKFFAEQESK